MMARGGRLLRPQPWARLPTAVILAAVAAAALLAAMIDIAVVRSASGAAGRLSADETVVVWSHGLESADAAAARAGEVLSKVPGVTQARWLDPSPSDALLGAALGAPSGAEVRLVSVTAPGGGGALARLLVQDLTAQDLPARAQSRSGMVGAGAATPLLAAGVLVPLAAVLIFAIASWMEARRELARGRTVIELMRLSGADEGFMAGEARRPVSGLAFVAALWGASGAMVAAALAVRYGLAARIGGLARQDLLSPWPALILALWLAGVAGAALSARARLKGMA
jgi:cell division transport system permease protein